MSFETAKKMVDLLLSGNKGVGDYINPQKSPGLIIDFIGGEPLLEIELIDQICSYTINRMIELNHPWLTRTMFEWSVLLRTGSTESFTEMESAPVFFCDC